MEYRVLALWWTFDFLISIIFLCLSPLFNLPDKSILSLYIYSEPITFKHTYFNYYELKYTSAEYTEYKWIAHKLQLSKPSESEYICNINPSKTKQTNKKQF